LLKNTEISNFVEICPVGAELFHSDRQTWRSLWSLFVILPTRLRSRYLH